jgi:hypothetical protein
MKLSLPRSGQPGVNPNTLLRHAANQATNRSANPARSYDIVPENGGPSNLSGQPVKVSVKKSRKPNRFLW